MQISGGRGYRPATSVGTRKTREITLSCGIKISAVCSFVSSQSKQVTDRWTGRQTDSITIPKTALARPLRAVKMDEWMYFNK